MGIPILLYKSVGGLAIIVFFGLLCLLYLRDRLVSSMLVHDISLDTSETNFTTLLRDLLSLPVEHKQPY